MKKFVYTLDLGPQPGDRYEEEITALTRPWLKRYCDKIGAELRIITSRAITTAGDGLPVVLEKFQLFKFAQEPDSWSYYFDSDALLRPDCPCWAECIDRGSTWMWGHDSASQRWSPNRFFRRDCRWLSACTWAVLCDDLTYDLWTPPEDFVEAVKQIHPVPSEWGLAPGTVAKSPASLIDDYQLSVNIARFGLKFSHAAEILAKLGQQHIPFGFHVYTQPTSNPKGPDGEALYDDKGQPLLGKRDMIARVMKAWGLPKLPMPTKEL